MGRDGVRRETSIHKAWVWIVCAACLATGAVAASAAGAEGSTAPSATRASVADPIVYRRKLISNRDAFGDAQKDTAGNAAADISDVTIFNTKQGQIYVVVTINQAKLFPGDEVNVFLDTDQSLSTGCGGAEYALAAFGQADPAPPTFKLARCTGGSYNVNVSQKGFAGALDTPRRQVDFLFTPASIGRATRFRYSVATFWSPNTTSTFSDRAPDTGVYRFALERAKILCRTVFARLVRDPGWVGVVSGGVLVLHSLHMRGVPAGATVSFQTRSVSETVRANSAGVAKSRRMINRPLARGRVITVRIRKGACSTSIRLKVNSQGRLVRAG